MYQSSHDGVMKIKEEQLVAKMLRQCNVILDKVEILKCEECPCCFLSHRDYTLHKLKHVQNTVMKKLKQDRNKPVNEKFVKKYKCDECDFSFVEESTLKMHSVMHEPFTHVCSCGIGYYKKNDLFAHKKLVHTSIPIKETKPKVEIKTEIEESEHEDIEATIPEPDAAKENVSDTETEANTSINGKPKIKRKKNKIRLKEIRKKRKKAPTLKKKVQCQICNIMVCSETNLQIHMRTHTGERPYECNQCHKKFSQSGGLDAHKIRHFGIKNFPCSYCGKAFYTNASMKLHERTHTNEKPYSCTYCGKKFADPSAFARHIRTHTGHKPYLCPYCGKAFSDASGLIAHKKIHVGVKRFKCEHCTRKSFYNNWSLQKHIMNMHLKIRNFECDDCGKLFGTKRGLELHIEFVHLNRGVYCPFCSCRLLKDNLQQHIHTHEQNGYPCKNCKRVFPTVDLLESHSLQEHGAIKYQCATCCKTFLRKSSIIRHTLLHSKLICDICHSKIMSKATHKCYQVDRCGNTKDNLKQRKDKHYTSCIKCSKKFMTDNLLKLHMRKAHKLQKYLCNDCGKSFCTKTKLKNHILLIHTESLYCDVCYERFFSDTDFRKHKANPNGCTRSKINCKLCGEMFNESKLLEQHLEEEHKMK